MTPSIACPCCGHPAASHGPLGCTAIPAARGMCRCHMSSGALAREQLGLTDTPPVPARWYRDQPPRDLRERFIEATLGRNETVTAEQAWSLITDAWRVIEVACARAGSRSIEPEREEWYAALRVAIFRSEHAEAVPELPTPL